MKLNKFLFGRLKFIHVLWHISPFIWFLSVTNFHATSFKTYNDWFIPYHLSKYLTLPETVAVSLSPNKKAVTETAVD